MAKANDPPLAFGEIIDRIEQMREELLILQRSLEKMEDPPTNHVDEAALRCYSKPPARASVRNQK